jgi:hypothetical protein
MKPIRPLTMAALLLAPLGAHAGRPMTTDDATVLDAHTCQLEAWWQRLSDHREAWLAPSCSIGPDWEAGVSLVRASQARTVNSADDADGANGANGMPSTHSSARLGGLYAKTVLRRLATNGWGLGLVASHMPQASGSMAGDTSLNVPLSVSLADDAVLVHANAGWTRQYAIRQGGATWALGTEVAVGPRAAVTLETYGSARDHSYIQAGARYSVIPNRLDVDASYGERLSARGKQGFFAIGLTVLASLSK